MIESDCTQAPSKKSLIRTDKGKWVVIDSDVEIGFEDDDSDDSSFNGDMTYDSEMQFKGGVSIMSEEEEGNGSDYSLVDEDEAFNHISEHEVDYYEKVYAREKCGNQRLMVILFLDNRICLKIRNTFLMFLRAIWCRKGYT